MRETIILKLNKRKFKVRVNKEQSQESKMQEAYDRVAEQINANNEKITTIFFEELEVVNNEQRKNKKLG